MVKACSRPRTLLLRGGESRSGKKIPRRKACRFDSGPGHHHRPFQRWKGLFLSFACLGRNRATDTRMSSPTSASGRLAEPSIAHRQACTAAGLELTLHGLRRSFATLCEWLDIPGGISAQIQGHAPQGVREQKYIRRPLDLLRVHHEKIKAWILEQAGIVFDAMAEPGKLRTVP